MHKTFLSQDESRESPVRQDVSVDAVVFPKTLRILTITHYALCVSEMPSIHGLVVPVHSISQSTLVQRLLRQHSTCYLRDPFSSCITSIWIMLGNLSLPLTTPRDMIPPIRLSFTLKHKSAHPLLRFCSCAYCLLHTDNAPFLVSFTRLLSFRSITAISHS